MATASGAAAGASAGLDLLAGLFGYFMGEEVAATAESRARMLRAEAEFDAQRYAEQATSFRASQKLAYLKSGVELSGSPLDVLDETMRVATENINAMRAQGRARVLEVEQQAATARTQGRTGLLKGIAGGFGDISKMYGMNQKVTREELVKPKHGEQG